MSKIGKKPILIPEGIQVAVGDRTITVRGKNGAVEVPKLAHLNIQIADGGITITPTGTHFQAKANWGTLVSLLRSAITGVVSGFEKTLEIEGIGFKAAIEGDLLVLNVGFTHPVKFKTPAGVSISVEKNVIKVRGMNKAIVGQTAAQIRKIKKPEPYKGKGIHYKGEVIRRKAGKKAATAGAAAS